MTQAEHIKDLHDRLRTVIQENCNTIGCKNCDLKWSDENGREHCSATDLDARIHEAKRDKNDPSIP